MNQKSESNRLFDLVQRLRGVNWVCHTYGKDEIRHDTVCHEAADAIEALEAENERLKAAFRVNMLRCFSDMSHEEIDVEIAAAVSGERE